MVHGYFESNLILCCSILFGYLSLLSLKYVSSIIKILFISTFFMFKYFIFAYIGSVLLNVFYFEAPLYNRPDFLISMWIYGTVGLFLLPLGMPLLLFISYKLNYNLKEALILITIYMYNVHIFISSWIFSIIKKKKHI